MITKILKVRCLTNLHVGNGDENFDIIDNSVERDPVTGYATINASGVKGAIKEAFAVKGFKTDVIFGAEGDGHPGLLKFLSANLIARPMRVSKGDAPYVLVTTECAISIFNDISSTLGVDLDLTCRTTAENTVQVEGIDCPITDGFSSLFGIDKVAVIGEADYQSVCLPVVARNKLGANKNLWYEEIVPHMSIFYIPVIANKSDEGHMNDFIEKINQLKVIQFGGNASIGCGLCEVSVLGGK